MMSPQKTVIGTMSSCSSATVSHANSDRTCWLYDKREGNISHRHHQWRGHNHAWQVARRQEGVRACVRVCVCAGDGERGTGNGEFHAPVQLRFRDVHEYLLAQRVRHHVQHLPFREQRPNRVKRFEEAADSDDQLLRQTSEPQVLDDVINLHTHTCNYIHHTVAQ